MTPTEVVATIAAILTAIGVPVGILWREVVRSKDRALEAQAAECERALEHLQQAHTRELAARDREIADRDRRLEAAAITEARLINMAFRGVQAAETASAVTGRSVERAERLASRET